jgi:hypothetical protein
MSTVHPSTPDISLAHADTQHKAPLKEESMTASQRFVVDENCHVIDKLNSSGPRGYWHEDESEDEMHLREKLLWQRLIEPVDDLIINLQPEETHPDGTTYRPPNDEAHSLRWAIYQAILASQWNMLDPAVSIQNRFDGTLKRQKTCLQEVTSLSLFRDDVERLLRDLYGDIDSEALERTLRSTLTIVEEFTRFVRKDLWQEHQDAENWDFILGIGVPEGMGINGSDWRCGLKACDDLRLRARKVSENPSAFSKYTVEFATIHLGQFIKLEGPLYSDDPELALDESPPF